MSTCRTERRFRRCEYAGIFLFASTIVVAPRPVNHHADRQKIEESPDRWRIVDVIVEPGDTLSSLLQRFDVSPSIAWGMVEALRPYVNPRKIQTGQSLRVIVDSQQGTLKGLTYRLTGEEIRLRSTPEGLSAERSEIPSTRKTRVARGVVLEDFYRSGREAGLTADQIIEVADVFRHDVDFFSDFRRGDTFSVLFEEIQWADGRRSPGRILAVKLRAGSSTFQAVYYNPRKGKGAYYDMTGRSLHGVFLRAPLRYGRISSSYNLKRKHPILRSVRPHRAIDYAAPPGTPVVSVGSGTVRFVGWQKGYGKLVEVRHPNGFTTRYAHLSRTAPGFRKGRRVDQGDVIGHVGQTGLATGPNLHFEILQGEQKVDFLKMRLPRQPRLTGEELAQFIELRDDRLVLLREENNQRAVLSSVKSSGAELLLRKEDPL